MANNHISRDLFFDSGGRPYNNKDFIELQNRIQNNQKIYEQFFLTNTDSESSYVIEGCDSAGATGLVYLRGEVRYVPEDSTIAGSNPSIAYVETLTDENENRIYADENEKRAFVLYKAQWVLTTTSGQQNIRFISTADYTNKKIKNKGFVKSIIESGDTGPGLRGDVIIEGDGQNDTGNSKITVTIDESNNK
ncbi:MAG: hypothetical protein ACC656_10430, partial [Candidatus Heimdallarchaeota archaeon]